MRLILYGTHGCHLCEDAEAMLAEVLRTRRPAIRVEIVDIAGNRELEERFGVRIPVVLDPVSGNELGWPFDADRLSQFLQDPS